MDEINVWYKDLQTKQPSAKDVKTLLQRCMLFSLSQDGLTCDPIVATEDSVLNKVEICKQAQACACGREARAFQSEQKQQGTIVRSIKQDVDDMLTSMFTAQYEKDRDLLVNVFEAFTGPAERLLRAYAELHGMQYGNHILLAFKGGNIFRILLQSLVDTMGFQEACNEWSDLLQLSDLDFEVFLKDATPDRVRDACVLMTVALESAREWLQQNMPQWVLSPEEQAAVLHATDLEEAGSKVLTMDVVAKDSVVHPLKLPKDKACADKDTIFMPVPRVLRVREGSRNRINAKNRNRSQYQQPQLVWWGQTLDERPRASPLPLSYNRMLGQTFGGIVDAELLRVRRAVRIESSVCNRNLAAQVLDVSIAGKDDVKHKMTVEGDTSHWFQKLTYSRSDGSSGHFYAPTLRSFLEDLILALFVTNDKPWQAARYEKKVDRWIWVSVILCMITREAPAPKVTDITKQLDDAAQMLQDGHGKVLFLPLQNVVDRLKGLWDICKGTNDEKDFMTFVVRVKESLRRVANTLKRAKQQGGLLQGLEALQRNVVLPTICPSSA